MLTQAEQPEGAPPGRCGLEGLARRKLAGMTRQGREAAIAAARKLASPSDGNGGVVDPGLVRQFRRFARERMEKMRPAIQAAIEDVLLQIRRPDLVVTGTTVRLGLSHEGAFEGGAPHMCLSGARQIACRWETSEPDASRAYWELRGPAAGGEAGGLLARGYSAGAEALGRVSGVFELNLHEYLPPATPDPTQRFHIRVLPLAAEGDNLRLGRHTGHSLEVIGRSEPEPPVGLGPWSEPAVLDYGADCRQPPTQFDIDRVEFYRKVRIKVNWFRVDADQPGPGDEEYHLRAFIVEHTPVSATALGSFGAYLPVEEGDASRHTLDWRSYVHDLGEPITNLWPRLYFVVFSVLEEDSGDSLDDWNEAMAELASEALEGDLADEIEDFLQEIRDALDMATEELKDQLKKELIAYIGASALSGAAAIAAAFVGLIQAFARAGALDDHFGVETVTFALHTNDAARIKDGTGWSAQGRLIGTIGGAETDGRYESEEAVVQLFSKTPEAAGSSGIVSLGFSMELYDKETKHY